MTSPLSFDPSVVPAEPLSTERFRLAPLGPEHNESDFDAWMSSIDHIRATPGFIPGAALAVGWPTPMTSEENLSDLVNHADEFTRGVAYAFTILDPHTGNVIGCTYIDPDESRPDRSTEVETPPTTRCATVTCWVRASHAELDEPVAAALKHWLASSWNLAQFTFPGRD
jgi:RimJ/RimL family protein N-acetyltransferase